MLPRCVKRCNGSKAILLLTGAISKSCRHDHRGSETGIPDFHIYIDAMQIEMGLADGLHTEGANLGPSIVVALGPHTGGQLWIHRAVQGQIIEVQRWQMFNGRIPHRNLLFAGNRFSMLHPRSHMQPQIW